MVVKSEGQRMLSGGGATVTWKPHVTLFPHPSVAMTLTGVVPIGNWLPLGGRVWMFTGGQPPSAKTLKNTSDPLVSTAATVKLVGQLRLSVGPSTVTVNEQLVESPQVSAAVTRTVVVPIGKMLPLGGLATTNGGGLHPPLAVLVKKTAAPFEPVAFTTMFEAQTRAIAGAAHGPTVTVNEQLVVSPQASLAVTLTVVAPTGNTLPLGGRTCTFTGGHALAAVTSKNTATPAGLTACTTMSVEQFSAKPGGSTVTIKTQLVLSAQASLAVTVTGVVPMGN